MKFMAKEISVRISVQEMPRAKALRGKPKEIGYLLVNNFITIFEQCYNRKRPNSGEPRREE